MLFVSFYSRFDIHGNPVLTLGLVLVPLIFLGSAAIYVWKREIRDRLATLEILDKKTGEEAGKGRSTARFTRIKKALRKRKGIDVEHGKSRK